MLRLCSIDINIIVLSVCSINTKNTTSSSQCGSASTSSGDKTVSISELLTVPCAMSDSILSPLTYVSPMPEHWKQVWIILFETFPHDSENQDQNCNGLCKIIGSITLISFWKKCVHVQKVVLNFEGVNCSLIKTEALFLMLSFVAEAQLLHWKTCIA